MRLAELPDSEAITALINTAFRPAEGPLIEGDRIDLAAVRGLLQRGKFLIAHHHDELVGCVYVEPNQERAYVGLLAVDPRYQGAGLGSKLMNAAEDHCARAGCGFIDLRVINVREGLPRFYEQLGYAQVGVAPLTPGVKAKVQCHFIRMTKVLARNAT